MRLSLCIIFFTSTNKHISYYLMAVRKFYGFYLERLFMLHVFFILIVVVDQIVTMPRRRTGESDQLEKNKSLYKDMFRDMHYFPVQLGHKYAKHMNQHLNFKNYFISYFVTRNYIYLTK